MFRRILLVTKHTPYESYMQLKNQGKAPVALRWERLKNRHDLHQQCVHAVRTALTRMGVEYTAITRDELHRQHLAGCEAVVAVGGDGTVLNTSHFVDDTVPVLGINSDPTRPEDRQVTKKSDERRSTGALCALRADNCEALLPDILRADSTLISRRTRLRCVVRSTYTETKLPPALNDILIAHPSPAAVSRFRLVLRHTDADGAVDEDFAFNVWSSGIWLCTATGSSAAMKAAGGVCMDPRSSQLQYMVREHLTQKGEDDHFRENAHGFIDPDDAMHMRWNSQHGTVFVDGAHVTTDLILGDEVKVDYRAPPLLLYEAPDE